MPRQYADPQVREPLKIEVLPPNTNTPVLIKEPQRDFQVAPQPIYKDIVPSRPSSITEALPRNQSNNFDNIRRDLSNDSGWKTIEHAPQSPTIAARYRASSEFTSYFADSTKDITEPFMIGMGRRFAGSTPYEDEIYFQHQQEVNPLFDKEAFDAGLNTADAIKNGWNDAFDFTHDAFNNAWDFYKDQWDNFPDFGIPKIDFPSVNFPNFDFPSVNFPNFDFPNFDLKPHNRTFEQEQEQEQKEKEKRNNRQHDRKHKHKPTSDQLEDLKKKIPNGCYAVVHFMQMTYVMFPPEAENTRSDYTYLGNFGGGSTGIVVERTQTDVFGNVLKTYIGEERTGRLENFGWDAMEEGGITPFGIGGFAHVMPVYHAAIINLANNSDLNDYFTIEGRKVISINNYAIDGINVYCTGIPAFKPDLKPFYGDPIPEPPPPPTDPDMSCCSCADIAQIVKNTITSMRYTVNIPIVTCEYNEDREIWEPKTEYKDIVIFAVDEETASSQAQIYLNFATQALDACEAKNEVAIAAVPESWQVAIDGDRPQLIVLFAEVIQLSNGSSRLGRSRYPISIPHYNKPQEFKPTFPSYKKGQYMGKLVLKDNSKLIVNAASPTEAKRVIAQLVQYINPDMFRKDSQNRPIKVPKIIERGGDELKRITVTPTNANFFSTGRKDMNPDWVKQFA